VGSWSVRCSRGAGTGVPIGRRSGLTTLLTAGAGTYTVGAHLWVSSGITGNAGIRVSGTGTATVTDYVTERNAWGEASVTFTWDGVGTLFLDVVDESLTAGAVVYFDGLIVTAGADPVEYFDGDTTDTELYAYAWTGTPGNSTSTKTFLGAPTGGLDYGDSSSGAINARNAGSVATPLAVTFIGPLDTPILTASDWTLGFDITLVDGETLVVDTSMGTALLNGNADRAYLIRNDSDPMERCLLQPGTTNLNLIAASGTGRAEVTFRNARM
jgi:hypothetical protein